MKNNSLKDRFKKVIENVDTKELPITEVQLTEIELNPYNARKVFDHGKLQELANSIVQNGLLQPIIIVKKDWGYMLVGGERRYKAMLLANISTTLAHIVEIENFHEMSLIENIQREDLTNIETAIGINKVWKDGRYEFQKDLAMKLGISNSLVSRYIKIANDLSGDAIEYMTTSSSNVSSSVMIQIVKLPTEDHLCTIKKYENGDVKRDEISKSARNKKIPTKKSVFKKTMILDSKDTNNISDFISGLPTDKIYKIIIQEM